MKLLHIIASPRGQKSHTLHISSEFLSALRAKYPDLEVEDLDLFTANLPDVFWGEVAAKYLLMGGGILDEEAQLAWNKIEKHSKAFLHADIYLISSPMWNFSIPYKLKQYIDIIMQAGILFKFTEKGVEGLAKNKKMFCITSRGSDYGPASGMNQLDFQEPYLRSIFGFAGITDISFINAQPMDYTPSLTEANLEKARAEARLMALNCELAMDQPVKAH